MSLLPIFKDDSPCFLHPNIQILSDAELSNGNFMGQLSYMGPLFVTLSGPDFILHTNPASLGHWLPAMQFQVLMGRGHKQVNGSELTSQ